jgi:hypothetical protein
MFGGIVFILYLCSINNDKMDDNQIYIHKVIPHIKKYIKKNSLTGMVEREGWFQFKYKVTGVTYKDDDYSWNRTFNINIEVSDKYWSYSSVSRTYEWLNTEYYWSARRRNQYIRTHIIGEVKEIIELFSVNCTINIGKIKMVN